jgi:hypothetical protein
MKQIALAAWFTLAAVLTMMAQSPAPKEKAPAGPVIRCKSMDGKGCTAKQVQALSDAVYAGKRQHEALTLVRTIELASPDGTLRCLQQDGTPCTTTQLDAVKFIATDQQLYLNYNSSKSKTGN